MKKIFCLFVSALLAFSFALSVWCNEIDENMPIIGYGATKEEADAYYEYYAKNDNLKLPAGGAHYEHYSTLAEFYDALDSLRNDTGYPANLYAKFWDEQYEYFSNHFWLPVGYSVTDVITVTTEWPYPSLQVVFKDRSWMQYTYGGYDFYGNECVIEPTEFIMYDQPLYMTGSKLEQREVEVYNLYEICENMPIIGYGATKEEADAYYAYYSQRDHRDIPATGRFYNHYSGISEFLDGLDGLTYLATDPDTRESSRAIYLEQLEYFKSHFWLPVGYTADDVITVTTEWPYRALQVVFKDRSWMQYTYSGYDFYGNECVIEPTEFILFDQPLYSANTKLEQREVEVYNLYDLDTTVVDLPQECKLNKETF